MNELIQFAKQHKISTLCLWIISSLLCFLALSLQPPYYRLTGQIKLPYMTVEGTSKQLTSPQVTDNWIKKELPRLKGIAQYKKILPTVTTDYFNNQLILKFALPKDKLSQALPFLKFVASGISQYTHTKINLFHWEAENSAKAYRHQANRLNHYYAKPMEQALSGYYNHIFSPKPEEKRRFFRKVHFLPAHRVFIFFPGDITSTVSFDISPSFRERQSYKTIASTLYLIDDEIYTLQQKAQQKLIQAHSIHSKALVELPIIKQTAHKLPIFAEIFFALLLGCAISFLILCGVYFCRLLAKK